MLLAVDIGNTNIVLGVYNGTKLSHHWRINTDHHKTTDEYGILIKSLLDSDELGLKKIKSVIISCVVPPLLTVFEEISRNFLMSGR